MSSEQPEDTDPPAEAFSTVWVKMEVEDDEDEPEDPQDTEDYQDNDDNYQSTEDTSQEPLPLAPRRKRRKPAAPRKAKNIEERFFNCEYCDYKAIHKSSLKYHLLKHTNPDPLPCSLCSYTTTHPASLKRHTLSVHTDENDPIIQALPDKKCNQCDFTCKFSWKLFIHKRKHDEKSFHCSLCDFSSSRKANFEKHCNTHKHKKGITYECDKCPFVTKHEGHIARHLAVIHKEVAEDACKCDHCEFSTKIRWRLNIHKKNSHQEKPIKCEFCEFVTEYNCEYKLHKQQHINDMALVNAGLKVPTEEQQNIIDKVKGKMSDCPVFESSNEKEFIVDTTCEEIDWRSIEVGESPGHEKPFHCILCQYRSKFKASVQRHFQRNHTSATSKPYKCVNCGFCTKTRDQISLHNKRSRSGYQLTCKACEFVSYYKCQMAEHQKVHWQFKCKLCDFVCRISYDLNTHYTVVHLGQGLKCRFCDFQAARKGSLLNHENTHTNKRFRCGLCDYSATRRSLLLNHVRKSHAGEKPKIIISDRKFEFLKKVDESLCEGEKGVWNVETSLSENRNEIESEKVNDESKLNVESEKLDSKVDGQPKNVEGHKSIESYKIDESYKIIESYRSDILKTVESYRNASYKGGESYENESCKSAETYKGVETLKNDDNLKKESMNENYKSVESYRNEGCKSAETYKGVETFKNDDNFKNNESMNVQSYKGVESYKIAERYRNESCKSAESYKGVETLKNDDNLKNNESMNVQSYKGVESYKMAERYRNESRKSAESYTGVETLKNDDNFKNNESMNVQSYKGIESYKIIERYRNESCKSSESYRSESCKSAESYKGVETLKNDDNFKNHESINYKSVENNKSDVNYKNDERQNKFDTQLYVQRQSEYERKDIGFESNMYGAESMRNRAQESMYQIQPGRNIFYPM